MIVMATVMLSMTSSLFSIFGTIVMLRGDKSMARYCFIMAVLFIALGTFCAAMVGL